MATFLSDVKETVVTRQKRPDLRSDHAKAKASTHGKDTVHVNAIQPAYVDSVVP